MEVIRGFHVIKEDGMFKITVISNTVDESGNIMKLNNQKTKYVTNDTVKTYLENLNNILTNELNV